jgi:hypothetical protein
MWNFQIFPITINPFTAFLPLIAYQSSIMGALVISRNNQMPTMTLNPIYPTAAYTPPNRKAPYATAVNSDSPINSRTDTAHHLFILSFMLLFSLY